MQKQTSAKFSLAFWLIILLVGLTMSCAVTGTSTETGQPVKGATKLLEFSSPR